MMPVSSFYLLFICQSVRVCVSTHLIQIIPDSLAEMCLQGSLRTVKLTVSTNLTCVTPALRVDAGEFSVQG